MGRISEELEEKIRRTMGTLYTGALTGSNATPEEVLRLFSMIILDISRHNESVVFESYDVRTRINILSSRCDGAKETLFYGSDGASSELADFFTMLAGLEGYSFDELALIYSVNSMPNVNEWFTELHTETEWKKAGYSIRDDAVPVYLPGPGESEPLKLYDAMYAEGYIRDPAAGCGSLISTADHDIRNYIRYSRVDFVQNQKLIVRARYDGRNNRILFKGGSDKAELYKYVTRAVADVLINREVGEGPDFGLTGFYELAGDIITYVVSARRGIFFNDLMNDRIRNFHGLFRSDSKESFYRYMELIVKVTDQMSELLRRQAKE